MVARACRPLLLAANAALRVGLVLAWSLAASVQPAGAVAEWRGAAVTASEWAAYTARFLTPDGRIVDHEGGGVSHSEGQGYGMLLALEAGDRHSFDRIWHFTRTHMQIRRDALISWRWDPRAVPPIADRNNATDGDILIAYALVSGAAVWDDARLMHEGLRIVDDIAEKLVHRSSGLTLLRPAAHGFDDMEGAGGPVVNLSYYIYPALRMFRAVRPEGPWARLIADGERLTAAARFGALGLPPDWIAVGSDALRLPPGLRQSSSYDAVRIPLYMLLDGSTPTGLAIFDNAWMRYGGTPLDYNLHKDRLGTTMNEPGYRLIGALTACAVRGAVVDRKLTQFAVSNYFASTLHLLAIAAVRRTHGDCLHPQS